MRAALALLALLVVGSAFADATLSTPAPAGGSPTATPLAVPYRVVQALARHGYPGHRPCGRVMEPPPRVGDSQGIIINPRFLPACWLVIYRGGYSVDITPYSNRAAAKLAYHRIDNKWALTTRRVVVGRLLVSGFRVPAQDWSAIQRIVTQVASH